MSHSDFPVDLPEEPRAEGRGLRWTIAVVGVAALSLIPTNAASIYSWGTDLTPGPRVAQFVAGADAWRALTARAGLGGPRDRLHHVWKRLEAAHWPGERTGAPYTSRAL